MDSLCCELVGVNPEKICCRSPPGAWSCLCLPCRRTSTRMVTLIERHWTCLNEGSGAAQEAPSLRSRKTKGWFPPPLSPNVHTTSVGHGFESQECQSRGLHKAARTDKCGSGLERPGVSLVQVCASQSPARYDLDDCTG